MFSERRSLRGGSWYFYPEGCRSADRYYSRPAYAGNGVGFRVVCILQPTLSIMARISRVLRGGSWFDLP